MAGARYISKPVKDLSLPHTDAKQSLITLIEAEAADLEDENWLEITLGIFRGDDVWTADFLEGVLISTSKPLMSAPSPTLIASIARLSSWHAMMVGLNLPVNIYPPLSAFRALTMIDGSIHTL